MKSRFLASRKKLAGSGLEDLLLLDRGVEGEVKVVERAHVAKARGLHVPSQESLVTDGDLVLEDELEELVVREAIAGYLLQANVQCAGQAREP